MIYEITMPSLGADMDKGLFVEWKVKVGDHINKDQGIAVIETQKGTVDLDSFKAGKILEVIAKPGEIYPVGTLLARMELDVAETPSPGMPSPGMAPRLRISPAARRLAEQEGLDWKLISGSGPEGVIELEDVKQHLKSPPTSFVDVREAIARAMARSKKEIPHFYLKSRVCVDRLLASLDEINHTRPPEERVLVPTVLVYAVARALTDHPGMNGYFTGGKFIAHAEQNIGMAVNLKSGGVISPALLEVQTKDLFEINAGLKDLIQRTREGKLKTTELSQGTITITNLGDLGSQEVFGVIYPPQVALVGFGQIRKEAVVDNSGLRPGYVLDVTLSADHRVNDGISGSRFLQAVSYQLTDAPLGGRP
ncbi:MAG: dihydrolipoamide acetyltransferase family protein [Pseudobdellovibrionaceae bacterium]